MSCQNNLCIIFYFTKEVSSPDLEDQFRILNSTLFLKKKIVIHILMEKNSVGYKNSLPTERTSTPTASRSAFLFSVKNYPWVVSSGIYRFRNLPFSIFVFLYQIGVGGNKLCGESIKVIRIFDLVHGHTTFMILKCL